MKQYFCILFYISQVDNYVFKMAPLKAGFCSVESGGFVRGNFEFPPRKVRASEKP